MRFDQIRLRALGVVLLMLLLPAASAQIEIIDETGTSVTLSAPATRIISLAPHLTEQLYEIGAGGSLVGVIAYSDYPEAAQKIPRIGDAFSLDFERIVKLRPDLIVGWASGNRPGDIERLRELGLRVVMTEPRSLDAIAQTLELLGALSGRADTAKVQAGAFRQQLAKITDRSNQQSRVKVFYQLWDAPLMTINRNHLISEVIERCGGDNVFSNLETLTPQISREAVVRANPDAIVSASANADPAWANAWQTLDGISAVKNRQFVTLFGDQISRASSRILKGTVLLCENLAKFVRN